MKKYIKPEIEIVEFEIVESIAASNLQFTSCDDSCIVG